MNRIFFYSVVLEYATYAKNGAKSGRKLSLESIVFHQVCLFMLLRKAWFISKGVISFAVFDAKNVIARFFQQIQEFEFSPRGKQP